MTTTGETGGPKTWGKAQAEVEFDEGARTKGPFTEVISEYRKHEARAASRIFAKPEAEEAANYYHNTANLLEAINQV